MAYLVKPIKPAYPISLAADKFFIKATRSV
jgi:hypothetical protein